MWKKIPTWRYLALGDIKLVFFLVRPRKEMSESDSTPRILTLVLILARTLPFATATRSG